MEAQGSTGRAPGAGEFNQQQHLDPQQSNGINVGSGSRPSAIKTNVIQFRFNHQGSENHVRNDGHGELPVQVPVPVPVLLEAPTAQTSESEPSTSTSMLPSGSNLSKKRKQREMVPADKKDDAYWQKRLKNNASVRKCRAAAKAKSKLEFEARLNRAIRMVHKIRRLIFQLEGVIQNLMEMANEQDGFQISLASDSDSETETGLHE